MVGRSSLTIKGLLPTKKYKMFAVRSQDISALISGSLMELEDTVDWLNYWFCSL